MPSLTQAGYVPPQNQKGKGAPPKPSKPRKPKKKRSRKRRNSGAVAASLIVLLVCAVIGGATLYMYLSTEPYLDAFCPGTTLSGYPMGGSSYDSGETLLAELTDEAVAGWSCALTWAGRTYTVAAQDITLHVDVPATLDPLWQAGREGGLVQRFVSQRKLMREGVSAEPVLVYDMAAVDALLERMKGEIECDPVDARVTFAPGSSEPFRFTAESVGRRIDTASLRAEIERAILALTPETKALEPEVQILEPAVYRAELENAITLRARVVLPIATDEASLANASLAARELNGQRAEPGKTFSFNGAVGTRTADAGYVEAGEPAYGVDVSGAGVSGAGVSGVGGGVCQIATALYQAALFGGIEVSERHAAARPVPYSEPGLEAAVSDQGLDLVLLNDTRFPLFVTARVYRDGEGACAEVQLIGEPLEARYALQSDVQQTEIPEKPVYVRDSEGRYATYTDERVSVSEGEPGCTATVHRIELDASGAELSRETLSTDTYDPIPPAVYVGVIER